MKKSRILIVDDEAANRGLVRRVLDPLGYEVVEACDGQEALAAIAADPPDLVLLDLVMPRMDGYAVVQALKSDPETRLIPVVMLTSQDQLSEKVRAVEYGVDDYLYKPFHVVELTARVQSLLNLKRYTDELEHVSKVIEGIAEVVESRDRYTGNHCKRLGSYAVRVGRFLKLGQEDLDVLKLGGVLHDLGKIAVSDTILNKPGRLTPEEFELMKSHPQVGSDLLRNMRTLERVMPLVRHHHEKLDGTGYPDRIGGKEIPLLVRITSVVDVFDALHSRRPYKEPFDLERSLGILREEATKGWWDREVVEALDQTMKNGAGSEVPFS
ncbi:MAG TPA: HD domain-containing phosphohydrolase [Planctomycetota bacterium]|jgi:putative two-component system response regulator|nr:HD domain-containing phosphohydrolase [Planctomycetota bacterium]